MSISVLLACYTVGKMESWVGIVFVEEEVNIFLISLMGTTIQDGGSRGRKGSVETVFLVGIYYWFFANKNESEWGLQ